jgi:hypothetical protein
MPVDLDLLASVLDSAPHLLHKSHAEAVDDRRFAEAVYRTAIAGGIMENIAYQDPPDTGDAG